MARARRITIETKFVAQLYRIDDAYDVSPLCDTEDTARAWLRANWRDEEIRFWEVLKQTTTEFRGNVTTSRNVIQAGTTAPR